MFCVGIPYYFIFRVSMSTVKIRLCTYKQHKMKTVGLFCFVCETIITQEEDMNLRESWRGGENNEI